MQQRDHTPGIAFPGCWTFFGGQVEAGEDFKSALMRELHEELGCVPGRVEGELFQWTWLGPPPSQNHYFPICCQVADDTLKLNEGQAMAWIASKELLHIPLTPSISENISKISSYLDLSEFSPRRVA